MKFWDSLEFGDQGTMDDKSPFDNFFKLSKTQRLYGFGICFVAGFVVSLMGTLVLLGGNLTGFAFLYTLGNIISLLSTGFLVGFVKQIKTMFAPVRWIATTVFLITMVITLIFAFTIKIGILCIIMYVVQSLALFWYCASYIPYGRTIIKSVCGKCAEGAV